MLVANDVEHYICMEGMEGMDGNGWDGMLISVGGWSVRRRRQLL